MYKLYNAPMGGQQIIRLTDNASIPTEPLNVDYQAYLQWVSQGNQPEPADE